MFFLYEAHVFSWIACLEDAGVPKHIQELYMIRLCWEFTVATLFFHVRFFLFSCLYKICRKAESFEVFEHTEKSFRIAFFSATPTEIAAFEKGNQDFVRLEDVKQV